VSSAIDDGREKRGFLVGSGESVSLNNRGTMLEETKYWVKVGAGGGSFQKMRQARNLVAVLSRAKG